MTQRARRFPTGCLRTGGQGPGLGVWEVIRDYLAAGKNERVIRKSLPQLSVAQVKACLLYYAKYPQEIQIAERLRKRGSDAIRQQRPHAGIVVCLPRTQGFETGAVVEALTRLAKKFPEGLGEYDVLYL